MEKFRDWTLLKYCGGGAFGKVYYAEDGAGKRVALKIVPKSGLDSWQRELNGVRNYSKIAENEPDLLPIYHVGGEDDKEYLYYSMEPADDVSGSECGSKYEPDTLARRLKSGALPENEQFYVLSEIFKRIKLLHSLGFAHRDIKPDNILFVKGVPKLADIGLLSALSGTFSMVGTKGFVPPEVVFGNPEETTKQRNDLYAFGKVIYCVITGEDVAEFPSTPKNFAKTCLNKYFLNLSFRLCHKELEVRLINIEEITQELADIERKLLRGETDIDKLKYYTKEFGLYVKSGFYSTLRFVRDCWIIVLVLLCSIFVAGKYSNEISGFVQKIFLPLKVQRFESKFYKLSMLVPKTWKITPGDDVRKIDWICINYNQVNPEGVIIKYIPAPTENLFELPEYEMQKQTRKVLNNFFKSSNNSTKKWTQKFKEFFRKGNFVSKVEYRVISEQKFIYAEYSFPENRLGAAYLFPRGNKSVMITLNCEKSSFEQYKKDFDEAVKTIKIEK